MTEINQEDDYITVKIKTVTALREEVEYLRQQRDKYKEISGVRLNRINTLDQHVENIRKAVVTRIENTLPADSYKGSVVNHHLSRIIQLIDGVGK